MLTVWLVPWRRDIRRTVQVAVVAREGHRGQAVVKVNTIVGLILRVAQATDRIASGLGVDVPVHVGEVAVQAAVISVVATTRVIRVLRGRPEKGGESRMDERRAVIVVACRNGGKTRGIVFRHALVARKTHSTIIVPPRF